MDPNLSSTILELGITEVEEYIGAPMQHDIEYGVIEAKRNKYMKKYEK